jgi:hypothetical protein
MEYSPFLVVIVKDGCADIDFKKNGNIARPLIYLNQDRLLTWDIIMEHKMAIFFNIYYDKFIKYADSLMLVLYTITAAGPCVTKYIWNKYLGYGRKFWASGQKFAVMINAQTYYL